MVLALMFAACSGHPIEEYSSKPGKSIGIFSTQRFWDSNQFCYYSPFVSWSPFIKKKSSEPDYSPSASEWKEIQEMAKNDPIAKNVVDAMDRTAFPCTDFYQYSCGSCINSFAVPKDRSSYNRIADTTFKAVRKEVRALLENYLLNSTHPNKRAVYYTSRA